MLFLYSGENYLPHNILKCDSQNIISGAKNDSATKKRKKKANFVTLKDEYSGFCSSIYAIAIGEF